MSTVLEQVSGLLYIEDIEDTKVEFSQKIPNSQVPTP